jgi:hypothetical protein
MPIKFKPSVKQRNSKMVNYYMHATSLEELRHTLDSSATSNKRKQKIRNELVRRKVSLSQ